jgi:hypothetical protein
VGWLERRREAQKTHRRAARAAAKIMWDASMDYVLKGSGPGIYAEDSFAYAKVLAACRAIPATDHEILEGLSGGIDPRMHDLAKAQHREREWGQPMPGARQDQAMYLMTLKMYLVQHMER